MDEEKESVAYKELQSEISKCLWNFSEKYFHGVSRDAMMQSVSIMQAVLCDSASEAETQTARHAPFTPKQIDHICYQIGEWYLLMKPLLEGRHNLGFMKEKLKEMIYDSKYNTENIIDDILKELKLKE